MLLRIILIKSNLTRYVMEEKGKRVSGMTRPLVECLYYSGLCCLIAVKLGQTLTFTRQLTFSLDVSHGLW